MNNNFPLVSVSVASFNNAVYIRETLDSIRGLDYPNLELLIVDDASQDDSVAVIKAWLAEYPGFDARLLVHVTNKGLCAVCNAAVRETTGKYFCLIGSDDVYLTAKLRVQVAILEAAGPEVGVVFSDISKIDPQGSVIVPSIYAAGQISPSEGEVWLPLLHNNFISAMSTLIRRSCLETVGNYDENLVYEDWDMWLRLSRVCKFIYQPEVTALYRIHGNSFMYKRYRQLVESNMRILSKHLGVSEEGDIIIGQQFAQYSEELYRLGSVESVRWLKERRRLYPDRRGLALLWLARLGIPADTLVRAKSALSQLVGNSKKENEAA